METKTATLDHLLFMLGELYDNRPLYCDSGLWQICSEDMKEVLYQQKVNEDFYDFIERCFSMENKIMLASKNGDI